TDEFQQVCSAIPEEDFFRQPHEKWSIAQNVKHLITSAKMTKLAYSLPKFITRIYVGKPNRPSRSYDELVDKYKLKLRQGGKASGRFIPEKISAANGKEKWVNDFSRSMNSLTTSIAKWNDEQLDRYIAPHPLLGKITHRELAYFTIYHIQHHLAIIHQRLADYNVVP
ncbi:MAG TPA: DinB family protein, partial [Chitinophagaceae bacterium]